MKEKIIQIYQLLNQVSVSGQQSIFALGTAMNLLQDIAKELEQEEHDKKNNKNESKD